MNKKQYEETRRTMLDEAQRLINAGKIDEAEEKMKEITALDAEWDKIAQAQANFNALNNEPEPRNVFGATGNGVSFTGQAPQEENIYDSIEYRTALMNYVVRGTAIPDKFRNEAGPTKTGDIGAVISPVVVNRIIEKMESLGMILPLVTKTSYAPGASIPTSSVKPVATWVAEGGTSEKQKKTTGYIDIKGYKLRCAISMTLEAHVMSLKVFETVFVNNVADAMVKAKEQAFISGDGNGKPKGVLTETPAGNVEIAKGKSVTYKTLTDMEGELPLAYENGAVWNMTKKTFMSFLGMVDADGQPIARENYGLNGKPERTLLGRKVLCNDYMPNISETVESDTVVAFLYDWGNYMYNTNYAMTVKSYEDNDTEDQVTKAVEICDGKSIDNNGLVTLTKKAA